MKRQGLNISLKELIELYIELKKETEALNKELGLKIIDFDKRYLVNIINREPECSDCWTIENERQNKKTI